MNFDQLLSMIPVVQAADNHSASLSLDFAPDLHVLLVVRTGHVTLSGPGLEPIVCAQGFACHPASAPYLIEVPRTKEAEYTLIAYRALPAHTPWELRGPLHTVSEVKIHYMLDELVRTCANIRDMSAEEAAPHRFRMRAMIERVLYIFLYESQIKNTHKSTSNTIDETLSYINEHYMNKLTLSMLAERAGMSEGHYTVLFKQRTGSTMTQYLRRLRIEKAQQMFKQTRLSAKEVALRAGFSDYFHFSRVFKQTLGCSPREYQRRFVENLKK
ncbi:AraC family transcriptional regulator [Cohnella cellulosilytica]|uniref:Helix-turn-helix domain-containing protein n=1 Tax=Cohnella cellulosilytica TaxID=986710 RepID=A0ABW2F9R4_9BACL